jgi:hypothetical protein
MQSDFSSSNINFLIRQRLRFRDHYFCAGKKQLDFRSKSWSEVQAIPFCRLNSIIKLLGSHLFEATCIHMYYNLKVVRYRFRHSTHSLLKTRIVHKPVNLV